MWWSGAGCSILRGLGWEVEGSWVKPGCGQNLRGVLVTDRVARTHSFNSPWARSCCVFFCILKCYFHHCCRWIQGEGVYPAVLYWLLLHFSLYLNNCTMQIICDVFILSEISLLLVMSSFCLRLVSCRTLLVLLLTFAVSCHCRLKWSDIYSGTRNLGHLWSKLLLMWTVKEVEDKSNYLQKPWSYVCDFHTIWCFKVQNLHRVPLEVVSQGVYYIYSIKIYRDSAH